MLLKIYVSNKWFLSIKESPKNNGFSTKDEAAQGFFNIDNYKKCVLSNKSAY